MSEPMDESTSDHECGNSDTDCEDRQEVTDVTVHTDQEPLQWDKQSSSASQNFESHRQTLKEDDLVGSKTDYLQGQETSVIDFHQSSVAESNEVEPMKTRSRVWEFFEKRAGCRPFCTLCKTEYAMHKGSTGSLRRHLMARHPQEWGDFQRLSSPQQPPAFTSAPNRQISDFHQSSFAESKSKTVPPRRKTSSVWEFFERRAGHRHLCTLCKTEYATHEGSTGSLRRHLMARHPQEWGDFQRLSRPQQPPAFTSAPHGQISDFHQSSVAESNRVEPMKKRSMVWEFFEKSAGCKPFCTLCKTELSGNNGSTGQLRAHLMAKHPQEWGVLQEESGPQQPPAFTSAPDRQISDSHQTSSPESRTGKIKRSRVWRFIKERAGSGFACTLCETVFSDSPSGSTGKLVRHLDTQHPSWRDLVHSVGHIADSHQTSSPESRKVKYKGKIKRSRVWRFIKERAKSGLICTLCKTVFSNSSTGSTGYLIRHLDTQHPSEWRNLGHSVGQQQPRAHTSAPLTAVQSMENGNKMGNGSSKKKELDKLVLQMICQDTHPFSLVSDKGFKRLVKALNPSYDLPDQEKLRDTLLPKIYNAARNELQFELNKVEFVAVSTEIWTSVNAQAFITVTVYYIDEQWKLLSKVLETSKLTESHTMENLAKALKTIFCKWMIQDKIMCVVSDGSENIVAAIRDLKYPHVPCFAHSLQLVISDSICRCEEVVQLQKRVQSVVSYFQSSTKASSELEKVQIQNNKPAQTLKEDVPTRWTSTLSMLESYNEEHKMVETALGVLGKPQLCLTNDELTLSRNIVKCLKSFKFAAAELSAEEHTIASKVMPIFTGLQYTLNKPELQSLVFAQILREELQRGFDRWAQDGIHGLCTYLDPRFKKLGIHGDSLIDEIESNLTQKIQLIRGNEESVATVGELQEKSEDDLWGFFDAKVSEQPVSELGLYNHEANYDRKGDPCDWWRQNKQLFPNLSNIAQRYLCIPATTIPVELLFSQAGEVASARRSCLKPETTNMVLFLSKTF